MLAAAAIHLVVVTTVVHSVGWFEAFVLGVVQGLTEFLPVSSSAHLRIVGAIVPRWGDPGAAFTAISQLGTESAVLVYFRHDIAHIITTWVRSLRTPALRADPAARMGWFVILGTIPIGILGLAFQDTITTVFRNLWLVAGALLVFGVVIGQVDRVARNRRPIEELNTRDALAYGFAQALALIPGVSRSGGTITAGLALGYTREAAARYSFLLAVPAVLISGLFELRKIGGADAPVPLGPTVLATVIAFGVGLGVIVVFLRYISTHTFRVFVAYRVVLGLVLFALLGTGVLAAG